MSPFKNDTVHFKHQYSIKYPDAFTKGDFHELLSRVKSKKLIEYSGIRDPRLEESDYCIFFGIINWDLANYFEVDIGPKEWAVGSHKKEVMDHLKLTIDDMIEGINQCKNLPEE